MSLPDWWQTLKCQLFLIQPEPCVSSLVLHDEMAVMLRARIYLHAATIKIIRWEDPHIKSINNYKIFDFWKNEIPTNNNSIGLPFLYLGTTISVIIFHCASYRVENLYSNTQASFYMLEDKFIIDTIQDILPLLIAMLSNKFM